MAKWKTVKIQQELAEEVKKELVKTEHKDLSDFVSEAIQHRLQTLARRRMLESLERDRIVGVRTYTCTNDFVHNVKVVKYDDSSVWVMCPMFGWFEDASSGGARRLGCKEKKKHCTWFVG